MMRAFRRAWTEEPWLCLGAIGLVLVLGALETLLG